MLEIAPVIVFVSRAISSQLPVPNLPEALNALLNLGIERANAV
jgi:hypothetical protein